MNHEAVIASLLFHGYIQPTQYVIEENMFHTEIYRKFVKYILKNYVSADRLYELTQTFVQKYPDIPIYTKEQLESIFEKYSIESLLTFFYEDAINHIWKRYKNSPEPTGTLEDIYDITEKIRALISKIKSAKENRNPYEEFKIDIERIKENRLNDLYDEGLVGLSTGIAKLDSVIKGLKPGSYNIIAGRPSMGKTSLSLDIAIDNIQKNKRVLFMSIEMTATQIIARSIPKINRMLTLENVVNGVDIEKNMPAIMAAAEYLEKSGLEIEDFKDNYSVTTSDIVSSVEKYKEKHGFYPDLVIIDYIQKISSTSASKSENEALTEVSNIIQRLSKHTNSVFIALSQLNRSLEDRNDKRPSSADLRGSGALEQDADVIMFVYREAVYLKKSLKEKLSKKPDSQEIADALLALEHAEAEAGEIIVDKNRNGATGTANVDFHKPTASYVDNADILFSEQTI